MSDSAIGVSDQVDISFSGSSDQGVYLQEHPAEVTSSENFKGQAPNRNRDAIVYSCKIGPPVSKLSGEKSAPKQNDGPIVVSIAYHPLAIGYRGDIHPSPEQILKIYSILRNAGITCCFVGEFALVYYGAARITHVSLSYIIMNSTDYISGPKTVYSRSSTSTGSPAL